MSEVTRMMECVNKAQAFAKLDKRKLTPTRLGKMKDFIAKLVSLKNEARELGLMATMHELDRAEQQVGWEVAEKM